MGFMCSEVSGANGSVRVPRPESRMPSRESQLTTRQGHCLERAGEKIHVQTEVRCEQRSVDSPNPWCKGYAG